MVNSINFAQLQPKLKPNRVQIKDTMDEEKKIIM